MEKQTYDEGGEGVGTEEDEKHEIQGVGGLRRKSIKFSLLFSQNLFFPKSFFFLNGYVSVS